MWTFLSMCWDKIFVESQFEDITVDLTSLNTFSRGKLLSSNHAQSVKILSEWFINGLPTNEFYLEAEKFIDTHNYLDRVATVTFRWTDLGWKPYRYNIVL